MSQVPTAPDANLGDSCIALDAFSEASRLITEARRHYQRGQFRRSASELAALPSVLAPLSEHVQQTWLEATSPAETPAGSGSTYL